MLGCELRRSGCAARLLAAPWARRCNSSAGPVNNIGDAGAAAIAEALKVNTTVAIVRLDSERALRARPCAHALSSKTMSCCALRTPSAGNDIGDAGAAVLATTLEVNTTVTTVDLRSACAAAAALPPARPPTPLPHTHTPTHEYT